MASNRSLSLRNKSPKDEFYTQLTDIEAELRHHTDKFRGKTVLCNCDDPYESNFFKYFALNFNHLRLKKLIATSYSGSPIAGEQLSLLDLPSLRTGVAKRAYKVEITSVPDANDDGTIDLWDVEFLIRNSANVLTPLEGDGDFRSSECVELLEESDIVVTNPPFSLFQQYITLLLESGKQFLILGDQNQSKYPTVFPHIMEDRLWFGYENGGKKWFRVPMDYEIETISRKKIVEGIQYFSMGRIYWYTNLDTSKRHEHLTLYKRYSPEEFPTYINYPAIDISRVSDIPMNYDGEMGVPITFLDKYNPTQFKIIGRSTQLAKPMSLFARREEYMTSEGRFVGGTGKLFIPLANGKYAGVYERIVIKRI